MGARGPMPRLEMKAAAPLADLSPPEWLEGEAAAHWMRHAPYLTANQLLSTATADAFAVHCDTYGRLMDLKGKPTTAQYIALLKAWNASSKVFRVAPVEKPGGPPTERHGNKGEFDFE